MKEGRMPEVDMLRSAPLGEKTSLHLTLYPYTIAVMYRLISVMPINLQVEQFIIVSPIIFFLLTILIVYILVQRAFDDYTALLSVNIMVFIPYLLTRTKAGFADRDSFVLLLSTISFLFYVLSLNDDAKMRWVYISLSAFAMLLTGLTWQGVGTFIAIIVVVELIKLMVDQSYGYRETIFFGVWVFPISLGLLLLKPDVYYRLDRPYALIAVFLPLIILLASILASIIQRVKGLREALSLYGRLPVGNASLILLMVTLTILFRSRLYRTLMVSAFPFGFNPLFQTIGELQKLGLIGWGLWPSAFWIPISIGLLLIVWDICKALKLHQLWTLGLIEIIVFGIAFSRLSSGISGVNFIETNLTLAIYWVSLGIGILGLIIGFIHAYLKRGGDPLSIEYTSFHLRLRLSICQRRG
ncbi:hypothetical protein J7M22_17890 [Candidatus Poribacteria bacterium]|nr:hypothetical protein [Candidatus Poribacteria bacterium]